MGEIVHIVDVPIRSAKPPIRISSIQIPVACQQDVVAIVVILVLISALKLATDVLDDVGTFGNEGCGK